MVRSFCTHEIRKQTELDGRWNFQPLEGEQAGQNILAPVPSCWETIPGFENYRGTALYSTEIQASGNVRLVFKGVSHTADVSFDGKEVAHHYNAFTPFDAIITNVNSGTHSIQVKVSNIFGVDSSLHVPNDYYTYGGINRPVIVENVADTYIEHVHAVPRKEQNGWVLDVKVYVKNIGAAAHNVVPTCTVCDEDYTFAAQEIPAGGSAIFEQTVACADARTYEIENPVLYMLKTVISCDGGQPCDDLIERIGFREVKVDGKDILFNGKKLRIKGFCRHEDHPHYGCAIPYAAMEYDLMRMKDLGANSVRTSHYPNDELFLDLCDEMGMLVWEENHGRGLTEEQMLNPNFRRQCEDCNREMVMHHINHPSIYIWGILNECASETEYGRSCFAEQLDQIRGLDSSRPVSFASCKFFTDITLGHVDIVSYNIYPSWYVEGPVSDYLDKLYSWVQDSTEGAGKPFIITETGAGGIYGYRNPNHAKWSEERQAIIVGEQIDAVLGNPDVSGIYIWQYCDVRVDEEWSLTRPRTLNNKGIVDEYRRPKLSYDTVKERFNSYTNYR